MANLLLSIKDILHSWSCRLNHLQLNTYRIIAFFTVCNPVVKTASTPIQFQCEFSKWRHSMQTPLQQLLTSCLHSNPPCCYTKTSQCTTRRQISFENCENFCHYASIWRRLGDLPKTFMPTMFRQQPRCLKPTNTGLTIFITVKQSWWKVVWLFGSV